MDSNTMSNQSDKQQTYSNDASCESDNECMDVPPAPRLRPMRDP